MIGYSVNITERKKIEEKIQLSEKRYRDLFNFSQAIICTHDMNGNFLSANPSLLEILGYEEHEVIGKNLKEFLQEGDQLVFDDVYLNAIRTNNKVKGIFKVIHKTGRKVYLLYQNYRVEESTDGDAYVIAFAQDVTDRINAEKELKEAKKLTEETARNKERFLANMSHEIRTPMNGIIGITSFLQKTQLTEEQRNYLNIVQESTHDLLTIINDILDLEKVGTGQIQLENIPFDIVAKTSTVIKLFELTARSNGLELLFENGLGNELCVTGDPTRFNQVLNNLISNSVKFTHRGTITVNASVEIETAEDVTVKFAIKDTGIGIDQKNIDKIFQPFTQAYPETTRKYGGTGLGLAITRNLVELQGGSIWVDSNPGEGSSFNFLIRFHKCRDSHKKLLGATQVTKNELGPLRILVAEDNQVNQLLTKGILNHLGFTAVTANTGGEVIDRLMEDDFDLILMDIQMPVMNGYEASDKIRNLPGSRKRNIPIIALTANALKGEEKNYIAAGMNGYLTKPFTEAVLYQEISRVIQQQNDLINSNKESMDQATGTTEKLYDLTLVSDLARGNKDFIINLAKIFIETVPPTAKEMVEACQQKKWEHMGKMAHKLKSTIDTMCINSLKDDIRIIEKNGKEQKDLDLTKVLVDKANNIIERAAAQLASEFDL
jgi:PAS domain S-box-containing protein